MNEVCVIIPAYNMATLTKKCVELVKENAGMEVDILVVDDGSITPYVDDSINVLRLDKNSGYTNATNQGILWCGDRYKYVHLLNNDIVPEMDFIKHLYDFMEKEPVAGIASSTRITISNGKKMNELYGVDLVRGFQAIADNYGDDFEYTCDWVPVCSSLVRMETIRYVGLLDRQFINHCSDSDYCIRVNQAGWNVFVVSGSKVVHEHQATVNAHKVEPYADQKRFIAKLAGLKQQELFSRLPFDYEQDTWGKLTFELYKKDSINKSPTT